MSVSWSKKHRPKSNIDCPFLYWNNEIKEELKSMKLEDIKFKTPKHVIEEIRNMNVKGGSAMGRAAAYAYKLACEQETFDTKHSIKDRFDYISEELLTLKPTMATIFNTKDLVYKCLEFFPETSNIAEIKSTIIELCERIINYSLEAVKYIGIFGGNMINDEDIIMMHSYSGSVINIFVHAAKEGKKFEVICTESRPLRESRLAVDILSSYNMPVTFITDASIWEFMPMVDYIIVEADTICCDGCIANKIGTALISQLALLCKKNLYVASEIYKLDKRTGTGNRVILEKRPKDEIISAEETLNWKNVKIENHFFDLTPARNITGLITEFGLINPAMTIFYWEKLEQKILSVTTD